MVSSSIKPMPGSNRSNGVATILAIGTATPPTVFDQSTYPDYYFRVTNNEDKVELKNKFRNLCEKTEVKKRHMIVTEEILKKNPCMTKFMAPSYDARQEIVLSETPKLGKLAAEKAIEEWGQPLSKITHLIFCTTTGVDMPCLDHTLTKLLGLNPSVKRLMLYHVGCFGGGTVLRYAKDFAENNRGSRVLVVCSENTVHGFRGPSEEDMANLLGQALFGDGAVAMIVGADPIEGSETSIFEIVSAAQTILPNSEGAVGGHMTEAGLTIFLLKNIPDLIATNIEDCLTEAFEPLGITDWNSIFWAAHPGGPAILSRLEKKVGLKPEKLEVSRHVLGEYGNMLGATVLFILDEMRKRSIAEKKPTTGEGLEWGVLFGFGPGLTVETVVLRGLAIK